MRLDKAPPENITVYFQLPTGADPESSPQIAQISQNR